MTAYTSKLNILPASGYASGDTLTLADGSVWTFHAATGWQLTGLANSSFGFSTDIDRAVARYRNRRVRGNRKLNIVGDSWAAGNGASAGAKAYATMLAADFAQQFSVSNYGYSGHPISSYIMASKLSGAGAAKGSLIQPDINDVTLGVFGLNDLMDIDTNAGPTGCGSKPANAACLITRIQAVATWFMVPESARVRMHTLTNSGPNPAVTFSGTWNHGGYAGNDNFSFNSSAASGDYVELTTPVGDLLIIRHATILGETNDMRVTVDGVDMMDRDLGATYDQYFCTDCTIIKLPTNAAHKVRLTRIGAGNLMVDSVDCVDTSTDFSATLLYSAIPHLTTAGWAVGSPSNSSIAASATGASVWLYDNGGCDRFAHWVDMAMKQLFAMGFNVADVGLRAGFIPASCTSSGDPLHPNDSGHAHVYRCFREPLGRMVA